MPDKKGREQLVNMSSSSSAKTKRDGRTDGWTDGGAFQYIRSFGAAGDKNT